MEWYENGEFHLEDDGPAVIDSTQCWYKNGEFIYPSGTRYPDGTEYWHKEDKLHREDGPAIIRPDGTKEYWLNGKRVRKEDLFSPLKIFVMGDLI